MPRKKLQSQSVADKYPTPPETHSSLYEDNGLQLRPNRKKIRNETLQVPGFDSPPFDPFHQEQVDEEETSNIVEYESLAAPTTFVKSKPVAIEDTKGHVRNISNRYTPPSEYAVPLAAYGESPNVDSEAISSEHNTPPQVLQPSFLKPLPLHTYTPTSHHNDRHARPRSSDNSQPPLPSHRSLKSTYGSPPAPSLYGAYDADPSLVSRVRTGGPESSILTKFVTLPPGDRHRHGVVTGYDRRVDIHAYTEGTLETIGTLANLAGVVIDAEILSWGHGQVFASWGPLIALTLFHTETMHDGSFCRSSSVQVYSLSRQKHVAELLRTPVQPAQAFAPNAFQIMPDSSDLLRLDSSGVFLSITSGVSGEIFVFTVVCDADDLAFECLGKFWTTIRPQPPVDTPRQRSSTSGASKTPNLGEEYVPIMSLQGRWLAVCAPTTSSSQSINAAIGPSVIISRHAGLELASPPARPVSNCDVESPDVDTLVSKVARGVAQEVVKGGKWLADQGLQAWNNYWKTDDDLTSSTRTARDNVPAQVQGMFPPTHAEQSAAVRDAPPIAVYDLNAVQKSRRSAASPLAVFQPPKGCSFLSFAPNGLQLLTVSRKGDYHYMWDLFELKYLRQAAVLLDEMSSATIRVRQLARHERLSGSVVVDAVWNESSHSSFALLTKNKTIHLYDIPASALKWPPARVVRKRPISAPPDSISSTQHAPPPLGGFLASAMSIAGKTQPMLTNLRGRAPSTSGGLSGIGAAGLGFAAATGARGSKAVVSGISKSLGAASEAVTTARQAGETRLSLKITKNVVANRLAWTACRSKPGISVLDEIGVKFYTVRRDKSRNTGDKHGITCFDVRKPSATKFTVQNLPAPRIHETAEPQGFWALATAAKSFERTSTHPLSYAEIETNAPYQPFHSDRRVTLSVLVKSARTEAASAGHSRKSKNRESEDRWAFGDDIATARLEFRASPDHVEGEEEAGRESLVYRETSMSKNITDGEEQIVSTTRRRKAKPIVTDKNVSEEEAIQEGFFEDDCDVLDFATDRV